MMKPIYKPSGKAAEYGDFCVNIYTGCNHGCIYCYAPGVMHKTREEFEDVKARPGLLEALEAQLASGAYAGKLIHLCFTCDPYPAPPVDTSITREVIMAIKAAGAHVQILTKGGERAQRDFDLLDGEDWFGVTVTSDSYRGLKIEPRAAMTCERLFTLDAAFIRGIKTWVSCEPVYDPWVVYSVFEKSHADLFRIGKLNYFPSDIDWGKFGRTCEAILKSKRRNYLIKAELRAEMEKEGDGK